MNYTHSSTLGIYLTNHSTCVMDDFGNMLILTLEDHGQLFYSLYSIVL